MKFAIVTFLVVFAHFQQVALAQSTTVIAPAPSSPTSASNNAPTVAPSSSTLEAPKVQPIGITYFGLYEGPSFSSSQGGKDMSNSDEYISNRPKLTYNFNNSTSIAIEPRIKTTFSANGFDAFNENWRLAGTFKKVFAYGIVSLDVVPRVMLPTSISAHNASMLPSPELVGIFNISPTNSRFSFTYIPVFQQFLFSNSAQEMSAGALTFSFVQFVLGTYQLTSKTALTFGWFPEYDVTKQNAWTETSNEMDFGVSFEVAKGWSLNPYIGTQPNGMNTSSVATMGKSMEAAMMVSGKFL